MRKSNIALGAGFTALAVAAAWSAPLAFASESITYSYDALGRLTASSLSGGPNNGRQTGTCFDRAGNRMRYDVATSTPTPCPTPTP